MSKLKKEYPVTLNQISNFPTQVRDIFLKCKPHSGAFIGTAVLEGSFMLDDVGYIYESLEIGERLVLSPLEGIESPMPPLMVNRESGEELGKLPYGDAILPNVLRSHGIKVWCYAEAKSFNGGILDIGVSIYSEAY